MNLILIIIIGVFIAIELANYTVFGKYLNRNYDINLDNYWLNSYDTSMLSAFNMHYITNLPIPIFGKYYIGEIGIVPRWSKLHKKIKNKFKELKDELG